MFSSTQIAFFLFGSGSMPEAPAPAPVSGASVRLRGTDESAVETSFRFDQSTTSINGPWTLLGTSPSVAGVGGVLDVTFSGLVANTLYWVRGLALNASGESLAYPASPIWTAPSEGVTGVSAGTITSHTVVLSFTPPTVLPATGYISYYRVAGTTTWLSNAVTPVGTNNITVTGLASATNYQFAVVPYNANILGTPNSEFAVTVSQTTATTAVAPPLYAAQAAAYGPSQEWLFQDATGSLIADNTVGSVDAVTRAAPGNVFGAVSIIPALPNARSIYLNGSDNQCKIQANGFNVSLPLTIEVTARLTGSGLAFLLAQTGGGEPWIFLSNDYFGGSGTVQYNGTLGMGVGEPHHMIAVIANGDQRLYKDGVLISSGTAALTAASYQSMTWGEWFNDGYSAQGRISHTRIYPRALTTSECGILSTAHKLVPTS